MSSPRPARPACPTIATPDNGALQQIADGTSGLFVPHEDPAAAAAAILRLVRAPGCAAGLAQALRAHVRGTYAAEVVVPQWQALFDEVLAERPPAAAADAVPQLHPGRLGMLDPPPAAPAGGST